MGNIKTRLSLLYFLQFAVWGSYLGCLGQFLGRVGLGSYISWFYAAAGLVSLFMPVTMGWVADRRVAPSRLLSLCHLLAALGMSGAWLYADMADEVRFWPLFLLYMLFLVFYMPTIALSNTVSFAILKNTGRDMMADFPAVRLFGTVGFVAAMWLVNSLYYYDGHIGFTLSDASPQGMARFQFTRGMLLTAAVFGVATSLYSLSLPAFRPPRASVAKAPSGWSALIGLADFRLFSHKGIRVFLCFAVLAGVCVQVTNGYATPFISHFNALPEFAGSLAAGNATMLFSLSNISEAFCILLLPCFMRRFGFRATVTVALVAWSLRFGLFAFGDTGSRLWMLVLSMLVYGIAFNFLSIAGAMYMERNAPESARGRAQGVLMMMSSGLGATLGMIAAGGLVNHFCRWEMVEGTRYFMGDWQSFWLVIAVYALVLAVAFRMVFPSDRQRLRS